MFCSWGAEEYGLLGSIEYVQVIMPLKYCSILGQKIDFTSVGICQSSWCSNCFLFECRHCCSRYALQILSHLNQFDIDPILLGNYTIRVATSPLLFDAIVNASKMVRKLSLCMMIGILTGTNTRFLVPMVLQDRQSTINGCKSTSILRPRNPSSD